MHKKILVVCILIALLTLIIISIKKQKSVAVKSENTGNSAALTEEATQERTQALESALTIDNSGSPSFEGHTPTTFEGRGTGLFIGDNLHPQFPEDAGLQTFVHFDLSSLASQTYADAILSSSFARIDGNPLNTLGDIIVESIPPTEFSSALWDAKTGGAVCTFIQNPDESFSCDVAPSIEKAIAQDRDEITYRLRFEKNTNGDGQPDLLSFRHYDPNANFPGLFQLTFPPRESEQLEIYTIPLTLYRITNSAEFTTDRTQENIRERFVHAAALWQEAGIEFDLTVRDLTLTQKQLELLRSGNITGLSSAGDTKDGRFHGFFLASFASVNGIAFDGDRFATVDETTVRDYRTTAHEIGHLLSLPHTKSSIGNLMYQGSDGHTLTKEQITQARNHLKNSAPLAP